MNLLAVEKKFEEITGDFLKLELAREQMVGQIATKLSQNQDISADIDTYLRNIEAMILYLRECNSLIQNYMLGSLKILHAVILTLQREKHDNNEEVMRDIESLRDTQIAYARFFIGENDTLLLQLEDHKTKVQKDYSNPQGTIPRAVNGAFAMATHFNGFALSIGVKGKILEIITNFNKANEKLNELDLNLMKRVLGKTMVGRFLSSRQGLHKNFLRVLKNLEKYKAEIERRKSAHLASVGVARQSSPRPQPARLVRRRPPGYASTTN